MCVSCMLDMATLIWYRAIGRIPMNWCLHRKCIWRYSSASIMPIKSAPCAFCHDNTFQISRYRHRKQINSIIAVYIHSTSTHRRDMEYSNFDSNWTFTYRLFFNTRPTKSPNWNVSRPASQSTLLIHWSQVLSREWRCSWSNADRRCSNYIWLINNCITY